MWWKQLLAAVAALYWTMSVGWMGINDFQSSMQWLQKLSDMQRNISNAIDVMQEKE